MNEDEQSLIFGLVCQYLDHKSLCRLSQASKLMHFIAFEGPFSQGIIWKDLFRSSCSSSCPIPEIWKDLSWSERTEKLIETNRIFTTGEENVCETLWRFGKWLILISEAKSGDIWILSDDETHKTIIELCRGSNGWFRMRTDLEPTPFCVWTSGNRTIAKIKVAELNESLSKFSGISNAIPLMKGNRGHFSASVFYVDIQANFDESITVFLAAHPPADKIFISNSDINTVIFHDKPFHELPRR